MNAALACLLLALGGEGAGLPAAAEQGVAAGAEVSDSATVRAVIARVDAGDFAGAEAAIAAALPAASPLDARVLQFQRERMRRIRLDFDQDAAAVQARVRRDIPDLTEEEFARWDAQGLLERMDIDGRRWYFNRAGSNLFRLSEEARARRADPKPFSASPLESANAHHREVLALARKTHASSVGAHRVRITQSLTVNADAVPAGKIVRAWIPYPQAIPGQQEDIAFVSSEPAVHQIAPESAPQRTVYLEKPAQAGAKTQFSITYEVTLSARHFEVDPDKVVAAPRTAALAPFVAERPPHIVFTNDMRAIAGRLIEDEHNPWRIAQAFYRWVDRIPWAGAREYSTITNLSDYALQARHADCGQQTLLLMAFLRMYGIPTRWQSGMMFADNGYWNLHDWGELYIAPYGWIPMDVTFGRLDDPDPAVAGFYLGSLDAWRIAFNTDYGRPLVPAKRHFRSETVDLQRGEAEWRGGNLYFDQWDYDFQATPVDEGVSTATTAAEAGLVDVPAGAGIALDIRYAGSNNFVGAPVDGYEAPRCWLQAPAAQALERVAAALRPRGLRLRVYDCYRPTRAVAHFLRWAAAPEDAATRAAWHPNLAKRALVPDYIADVSGHSRGATVDLTLERCAGARCEPLDMGTPFDLFDPKANTDSPQASAAQHANRQLLKAAMEAGGFENYAMEWWHYTWQPAQVAKIRYDVPIR